MKIRYRLKTLGDKERHRFCAEVERFGLKNGWKGPEQTILLKNIKLADGEKILTDHLWFTVGKQFKALGLEEGDKISFDARVAQYKKGYWGDRDYVFMRYGEMPPPPSIDYRLGRPTKIVKEITEF